MQPSPLHDRLLAVLSDLSYRQIADLTGTNAETTRRYLQGATPSVEFLAAVCTKLDLNAEWLLTGRGVIKRRDAKSAALREANASELLSTLAETLERLIQRVDRLEAYVHTVETRLRAAGPDAAALARYADAIASASSPSVPASTRAAAYVEASPQSLSDPNPQGHAPIVTTPTPTHPQRATPLATRGGGTTNGTFHTSPLAQSLADTISSTLSNNQSHPQRPHPHDR